MVLSMVFLTHSGSVPRSEGRSEATAEAVPFPCEPYPWIELLQLGRPRPLDEIELRFT